MGWNPYNVFLYVYLGSHLWYPDLSMVDVIPTKHNTEQLLKTSSKPVSVALGTNISCCTSHCLPTLCKYRLNVAPQ